MDAREEAERLIKLFGDKAVIEVARRITVALDGGQYDALFWLVVQSRIYLPPEDEIAP